MPKRMPRAWSDSSTNPAAVRREPVEADLPADPLQVLPAPLAQDPTALRRVLSCARPAFEGAPLATIMDERNCAGAIWAASKRDDEQPAAAPAMSVKNQYLAMLDDMVIQWR